jgi:hypothetical protein
MNTVLLQQMEERNVTIQHLVLLIVVLAPVEVRVLVEAEEVQVAVLVNLRS